MRLTDERNDRNDICGLHPSLQHIAYTYYKFTSVTTCFSFICCYSNRMIPFEAGNCTELVIEGFTRELGQSENNVRMNGEYMIW